MTISAVVLAKNEEENIADCLSGLSWCDEVIVVDDNSTDNTIIIAKKHGAKVITHGLENNFSKQRNFAMLQAKGDWIFYVDADERVSGALQKEIIENCKLKIENSTVSGYYIPRVDYMWGKYLQHGETGDIQLLRLARKNSGKWAGRVHEVFITLGQTKTLIHPLLHYPHVSVNEFLTEINFYSTLRAQELFEEKKKVSWFDIIFYPKAKFIKNYILKLGFLDGLAGLVLAILMSFHSFLVRAKLWQLWQNTSKKTT